MRFLLIVSLFSLPLLSCSTENPAVEERAVYTWHAEQKSESGQVVWTISKDSLLTDAQQPEAIIDALNNGYNEYAPRINFQQLSGDTLYISMVDEQKYSNQMGSTGAQQFLAELVFTLTEANQVTFVHLDIEIGSHGKPGVFSRQTFTEIEKFKVL